VTDDCLQKNDRKRKNKSNFIIATDMVVTNRKAKSRFVNIVFKVSSLLVINMGYHMSVTLLIIELFGCNSAITIKL